MKIIDLLNKIANGEEVPKHIKIGKNEWYFYKSNNTYGDKKSAWIAWDWYVEENRLNDEVEILEEEKKIPEKLDVLVEIMSSDKIGALTNEIGEIQRRFNQLIDYLKSKGE